jgi:hypothetical protein
VKKPPGTDSEPDEINVYVVLSFDPWTAYDVGLRLGSSFAVVRPRPVTAFAFPAPRSMATPEPAPA